MAEFQLTEHECRCCHAMRLNDGLKCSNCGCYENRNIQLVDGRYIDVNFRHVYPREAFRLRVRGNGA